MENEMDLSIARFIREQRERERLRKQYDPRERITYTLEEMIEGIRSGRQYLYTLLLEFEPKDLLEGRLTVPFIKNFYDVEQNEAGMILLAMHARLFLMYLMHLAQK